MWFLVEPSNAMPQPSCGGKGCFSSTTVAEETDVRDHCCAVQIVRRPCCCCWLSLVLALTASILGLAAMISINESYSAGPMRGLEGGLDYPMHAKVARQMDALKLSVDKSEKVWREYAESNGIFQVGSTGRRLARPDDAEPQTDALRGLLPSWMRGVVAQDFLRATSMPAMEMKNLHRTSASAEDATSGRGYHGPNLTFHAARELHKARELQSSARLQNDHLAEALFVFNSRSSDQAFTVDGLNELCALHQSFTTDQTRSGSYVGFEDFCMRTPNGRRGGLTPQWECHSGLTPLAFFFGDASYDIDVQAPQIVGQIAGASFDAIARIMIEDGNGTRAIAQYPTEGPAAVAVMYKLLSYLGQWVDAPITRPPWPGCSAASRKNITKVLQVVAAVREQSTLNELLGGIINYYFDRSLASGNLRSKYTRGTYNFGAPQPHGSPPYVGVDDRMGEQEDNLVDWFWKSAKLQDRYNEHDKSDWGHLRPTGLVPLLLEQIILDLLLFDALRAIAPLVLVFLIVWFQTRSIFLALVTIVECVLSCTASVMVLLAMGIQWLAVEQFLAIYIVLAIGADDVFVFVDAYKASFFMGPKVNESLTKRMSWVYRRAGMAMLITSLTTASAFFATALSSPIPTLQVFGIFAASVIILDYVLVMTLLCASVVIYHNHFENRPGLCCACCTCAPSGSAMDWWACHASKHGGCMGTSACCKTMTTSTAIAGGGGPETLPAAKPLYVRIFEDYFPFAVVVRSPITRALSIAAFLGLLVPFAVLSSKIEPQTAAEQFLPADHPFQRFFTAQMQFISSREDEVVEMQLVYGFDPDDPIDLSGVNRLLDPSDWGQPKPLATFTLDAAAQQALLDDCALLRQSTLVQTRLADGGQQAVRSVFCWVEAFAAYRACRSLPFPTAGDAAPHIVQWLTQSDYHQCPQEAWPFGRSDTGDDANIGRFDYTKDFGWEPDGSGSVQLTWTRLRADSTVKERAYLPATDLRKLYHQWEDLMVDFNTNAPSTLGEAMQISSRGTDSGDNKWLHMILQETYVRMALQGVAVGLSIAFVVLLIATMNLIVASLSILTIVFTLCCVVGWVVNLDWQLGSAESLSMMILTGFAVDYVVHLAHAYMESNKAAPVSRVHDALRALGISVFWGMLTSLISGYVLSTLQLQFFAKFGTFFLLTIVWAYLWAVLFLMPLLAFIGPRGVGTSAVREIESAKQVDA